MFPTQQEMQAAYRRIRPYVHRTPVLTSQTLDTLSGAHLYFKCENFQRMGAFKMRGAVNAILNIPLEDRERGVATHSSGNHGQALALAARQLGIPAFVVMPEGCPHVKRAAVSDYGATVITCENTLEAREKSLQEVVATTGATIVHPSNDRNVIIGQGTAAMELLEEVEGLQAVVTPVGGGGLLAGTALAVRLFSKGADTYAGEPEGAPDAQASLAAGRIVPSVNPQTIADGLRTQLGDVNFPIIKEMVKGVVLVSEKEIVQSMRLIWERMKLVVEPSAAVALAAVLKEKSLFEGKKVGILLSGGNVDLSSLPFSMTE